MNSITFFLSYLAVGVFIAAASIWALMKFIPDEMDREHRNKR